MIEQKRSTKSPLTYIGYLGFLVVLYLFIYNPPLAFLPVTPVELLILPSILFILVYKKPIILLYTFRFELSILMLILLFSIFREFGLPEIVFLKANIFFVFQTIIMPFSVILLYSKLKNHNNLLKDIIIVGVIATIITLSMIFLPSLGEFIRYTILKTDDFTDLISFRSFGLSEGLTFAYGTVQGLIFALVFYYSRFNSKYLYLLPFIFLSIIFNARIGLVPVIFSMVYFIFIKFNIKLIIIISVLCSLFYLIVFQTDLFSEYAKTIEWAFDFFSQSSDFVNGNSGSSDGNTFNTLFGEMAVLPQDVSTWLIGSGENIFVSPKANSDIGYLIELNYGGLIYVFLLLTFVFQMIFRLRFLFKENRWLIFLFLVTILVTNVKGLFISIIPSFRLIMLIYCYLIIEHRKSKKLGKHHNFNLLFFSN